VERHTGCPNCASDFSQILRAAVDNAPAVRLYGSENWIAIGNPHEQSLLKRPVRTLVCALRAD
jgi:hypothetical protein